MWIFYQWQFFEHVSFFLPQTLFIKNVNKTENSHYTEAFHSSVKEEEATRAAKALTSIFASKLE